MKQGAKEITKTELELDKPYFGGFSIGWFTANYSLFFPSTLFFGVLSLLDSEAVKTDRKVGREREDMQQRATGWTRTCVDALGPCGMWLPAHPPTVFYITRVG